MDAKQIRKDRMRYTKNTLSSTLTYLAILTNVFYFVNIYKSDVGTFYYRWIIGVSIVYNLLFMMFTFLCSEGVKNYDIKYSVILFVLGALQFVRIFIIPMKAAATKISSVDLETKEAIETVVMKPDQFTFTLICLIVSGSLCIIAGVVGVIRTNTLQAYLKEIKAN